MLLRWLNSFKKPSHWHLFQWIGLCPTISVTFWNQQLIKQSLQKKCLNFSLKVFFHSLPFIIYYLPSRNKHVCLPKNSNNKLYKLVLFERNPTLRMSELLSLYLKLIQAPLNKTTHSQPEASTLPFSCRFPWLHTWRCWISPTTLHLAANCPSVRLRSSHHIICRSRDAILMSPHSRLSNLWLCLVHENHQWQGTSQGTPCPLRTDGQNLAN